MKNIEYEERVMLKKSDYEKVIEDIKKEGKALRHLNIENIYLDNQEQFIYKTRKMLRIRTTDGTDKELTLKIKNPDNSNIEINETLDNHPLIDKELNNKFSEYKEVARLLTERYEVEYPNYLLVIDKNEYHGIVDYDLEIEAKNQPKAKEIIEFYCKKYYLLFDSHYKTKSHRAIAKAMELTNKK